MKRLTLITGTILALTLVPWGAPSRIEASSSTESYAVGGFMVNDQGPAFLSHWAFSDHQTDSNTPTGHVVAWARTADGKVTQIEGPTTCLSVIGNSAQIGFKIAKTANTTYYTAGEGLLIDLTDNGQPVDGQPADAFEWDGITLTPPTTCLAHPATRTIITSGNVVVHDPILGILPCAAVSDNATYQVNSACDVYYNTGSGWQLAE